jgi:hypothetical protein
MYEIRGFREGFTSLWEILNLGHQEPGVEFSHLIP